MKFNYSFLKRIGFCLLFCFGLCLSQIFLSGCGMTQKTIIKEDKPEMQTITDNDTSFACNMSALNSEEKKRKSYVTRPTAQEKAEIAQRRKLAIQLSLSGASIRQISSQLIASGIKSASPATICADLQEIFKEASKEVISDGSTLIQIELEKINNWEVQLNVLLQELTQGKMFTKDKVEDITKIINTLKTVQNQRDRFLALSKREKSKIDAREALAKLMGVNPEQLPKANEK